MPAYAGFIKKHCLADFVTEQTRLSLELKVPLLQYFSHMSAKEIHSMSLNTATEFLTFFENNLASEQIETSLSNWVNNQYPQLSKGEISSEDITLVTYIRKQVFLHFVKNYTNDVDTILNLIREIDQFSLASETALFKTYSTIVSEKIDEQVNLIEHINNTSPGMIYVFDLLSKKLTYSNKKSAEITGYTFEELLAFDEAYLAVLKHPDDLPEIRKHYALYGNQVKDEIRIFRHRLKQKDGTYRWVSNYESIFKRDEQGNPQQIIGISLDIDHLERTTEKLQLREEQLLQAQELAEIGSFEWNLDTGEGTITPQLLKILELDDDRQLLMFANYIHPNDKQRVQQITTEATRNLSIYDYECRYVAPSKEKLIWSRGNVKKVNGYTIVRGTIMDVSERSQLLQKLKRSDELFRQAQALSNLGNWALDIPTGTIIWSDELYRIYELEPKSVPLQYDDIHKYNHPHDIDAVKREMDKCLETGRNDFFYRIILKNGAIKTLHAIGETVKDFSGEITTMTGTVQDVTSQILIEKELQENQNLVEKIADSAPSIITSYNIKSGRYSFVNQSFKKLLGYEVNDLLSGGLPFFRSLIHPDDLSVISNKQDDLLNTIAVSGNKKDDELVKEFQYKIQHKDGSYRWLRTFATVFDRNTYGSVENILEISVDITEYMQAESKLLEQEHFIKNIAEASPTILYLYDLVERRFVYINKEVKQVLGYEPEYLVEQGDKVTSLYLHPEDTLHSKENYIRYHNASGAVTMHQFEGRVKHKNKKWVWILTREIVYKRNAAGKPIQVLGSALDITLRKEMEQSLVYKTLQLQQSNASLEEFAHVSSHDLQEPLRKISTYADRLLLSHKDQLSTEGQTYLSKIVVSATRMQQLINDILSISIISGNKDFEWCNLTTLVEDVLQTLEYKIERLHAVVTVYPLPMAHVNPSQIRQLFQNILSNSLKFSKENISPEITIRHEYVTEQQPLHSQLQNASGYHKILVSDNGIGFDNIFADKIFNIFQRLNGKSEYEGTGIGLSICKKILENHGGTISAISKLNEGAKFIIMLPEHQYSLLAQYPNHD